MSDISFLIGSGLSKPANLPMTTDLNNRLAKIDSSEICIHPNGFVEFLNGQTSPYHEFMKAKERKFIQKFLEYYNKNILDKVESFHYEKFYDYYQGLIESGNYPNEMDSFFTEFTDGNNGNIFMNQLLFEFNKYFNQLIRNLLFKKFSNSHLCAPYSSNHKAFLLLLEELSQSYTIHIHSLNHDLYIEHLSMSDSIQCDLNDGFEEVGSPYYGEFLSEEYGDYNVRLSHFVNKFTSKFRLYKLHGSIDHYWFGKNNDYDLIKIKDGVSISRNGIKKEIEEKGQKTYISESLEVYPDFLSGKKSKIKRYNRGTYYPILFKHFENNLNNSNTLIVIGYGFGDDEITKYITKFYQYTNKKIFIVDITKPDEKLFEKENVIFIGGGVVDMNYKEIINKVI